MSQADWSELSRLAWAARSRAHLIGNTAVGAALRTASGKLFAGCNVEHRYRCHDIHAEVNAIGQMVAGGEHGLAAVLVVAERQRFTPCGGCLDWIFQFGGGECLVGYQVSPEAPVTVHRASELMPFYPE